MTEPDPGPTTILLRQLAGGDAEARERLLSLVYGELRRVAGGQVKDGLGPQTLQPTALVHEAWIRLIGTADRSFENRRHFLGVASKAMRSVLIDHVREKRARKRGGDLEPQPLDEAVAFFESKDTDLLDLNDALDELGQEDEELADLVEMRFFGGLTHTEIAEQMECSLSSIERKWRVARARLHHRLGKEIE